MRRRDSRMRSSGIWKPQAESDPDTNLTPARGKWMRMRATMASNAEAVTSDCGDVYDRTYHAVQGLLHNINYVHIKRFNILGQKHRAYGEVSYAAGAMIHLSPDHESLRKW